MPGPSYTGGIRPQRIEYLRETTAGTTPADPAWLLLSDVEQTFEPTVNPQTVAEDGLGNPDSEESHPTVEANELSITYDLNQWLVDGGGNAQDAAYDAFARDADNRLPNTHTVVARMEQSDLAAGATLNGSTSYDTRKYFVGKGGWFNEATISISPSDSAVWNVEGTYMFKKARMYQIDQPSASTELTLRSTDSSDTGVTITVENEDASTSEDVSLDGTDATTVVSTTETYANVDAIEAGAQMTGDLIVSINDGTQASPTEGDKIAELFGTASYDHNEADLGIPALGTGSHASAIGSGLELAYDGDTLQRGGSDLAENVGTLEMSVSNNVEAGAPATSPLPSLSAGARDIEIAATVWGESEEVRHVQDMLQTVTVDYVWTPATGDSLTVTSPVITEVGAARETQQGRQEIELTLAQQEGVTIA